MPVFRPTFPLVVLFLVVPAFAQMGPQAVDVAPVRSGRAELSQPLVATVEAVVRSTLAAEEGGLVAERLFDEGMTVRKGDVLVRVNTDLLKAQLSAAEGAVAALQAQTEQAAAEQERAQLEVDRMRPVIEQRAAPQMQMDDAVRDLRVATAVVAGRKATLAEKQSDLQRLRLMIAKSEVRAPFDGFVARRHVEVGQWIKQGDTVADLVQLDPLYARASVPEQVVARIQPGQPVKVAIEALGGEAVEGKVEQILPEADVASRTVAVKVLIPNPNGVIRPGFFARATFYSSSDQQVLQVPKDAVVFRGPAASVVVARDAKAAVVPVRVLAMVGDVVSVEGEVQPGDQVVTRGNEQLRGGEALMIRGAPPPGMPTQGGPGGGPPGGRPPATRPQ